METPPFVPEEVVVLQILARLPVKALLRLRGVCKAWRDAIDGDASFHRAHIRLQNPSVLVALKILNQACRPSEVITAGLYRWDHQQEQEQDAAATLVHALSVHHSFPVRDYVLPDPAHCDGLLLLPADATARVLNPATGRLLVLPPLLPRGGHHAFGLGHDPRSNTYKVARFFYRSLSTTPTGAYLYNLGMEVCTVRRDQPQCWRETAEPPPYPIKTPRAATFFNGSLLWTVEESLLLPQGSVLPGFVRFKLDDESFSIMPLPPCCPTLRYATSSLAELRGELCLCVVLPGETTLEMWMCGDDLDTERPRWDRRHVLTGAPPRSLRLIAVLDVEIVFEVESGYLLRFTRPGGVLKGTLMMRDMRYGIDALVDYPSQRLYGYDVLPCVQSLIPL